MAAEARGAPRRNTLAKEHQEKDRVLGSELQIKFLTLVQCKCFEES